MGLPWAPVGTLRNQYGRFVCNSSARGIRLGAPRSRASGSHTEQLGFDRCVFRIRGVHACWSIAQHYVVTGNLYSRALANRIRQVSGQADKREGRWRGTDTKKIGLPGLRKAIEVSERSPFSITQACGPTAPQGMQQNIALANMLMTEHAKRVLSKQA